MPHTKSPARKRSSQADLRDLPDPRGLLEWASKDRCAVRFYTMDEVTANRQALEEIIYFFRPRY